MYIRLNIKYHTKIIIKNWKKMLTLYMQFFSSNLNNKHYTSM